MQSPYIKKMVKELGLPEKDVTKFWNTSIKSTEEMRGIPEEDFTYKEYNYTMQTVRHLAEPKKYSITEEVSLSEFMNSGKSAKEFLEVVTSGSFSVGDKTAMQQSKNLGKDTPIVDNESLDIDLALDKANKTKEKDTKSKETTYKKPIKKRENFEANKSEIDILNEAYEAYDNYENEED